MQIPRRYWEKESRMDCSSKHTAPTPPNSPSFSWKQKPTHFVCLGVRRKTITLPKQNQKYQFTQSLFNAVTASVSRHKYFPISCSQAPYLGYINQGCIGDMIYISTMSAWKPTSSTENPRRLRPSRFNPRSSARSPETIVYLGTSWETLRKIIFLTQDKVITWTMKLVSDKSLPRIHHQWKKRNQYYKTDV